MGKVFFYFVKKNVQKIFEFTKILLPLHPQSNKWIAQT